MSSFVSAQIAAITEQLERIAAQHDPATLLGEQLATLARPLIANRDVPLTAVFRLALLNDCLRIAERTIAADDVITDAEVRYVFPLASSVTPLLQRLRASYAEFDSLTEAMARDFLITHAKDRSPFGGRCEKTAWSGFEACRQLSLALGSGSPIRSYEALVVRLIDELTILGSRTRAEEETAAELRELIARQTHIPELIAKHPDRDGRREAFCNPRAPEVFHAVAHAEELWRRDPFDVESIHAEARRIFDVALQRVRGEGSSFGRTMVVLGSAGAGKTHLMRALRATTHGRSAGYVGYAQLGTNSRDYPRLLLGRLVDSLERAYDDPLVTDSGLSCLSDALVARVPSLPPADVTRLRDGELPTCELERLTQIMASAALREGGLGDIHADVIRAILLLQRRDPAIRQRVLKLLRCEQLSRFEQELLGDIAPWTDDDAPRRMLQQIGKLAWSAAGGALVLLIDQLEDLQHQDQPTERFVALMDCLRAVGDDLPHSVTVLACLEDFFTLHEKELPKPVRDRLDRDPEPVRLTANRDLEEIRALVAKRLEFLYESQDVRFREDEPLYPFSGVQLARLRNFRARAVLEKCGEYQERCQRAGSLMAFTPEAAGAAAEAPAVAEELQAAYQQQRSAGAVSPPDDSSALLDLIRWGVEQLALELDVSFEHDRSGDDGLLLCLRAGPQPFRIFAGLANQAPQGDHLRKQVTAMHERARGLGVPLTLLRSGEFPTRSGTKIARALGELQKHGAQKLVLVEDELRTLAELKAFVTANQDHPQLRPWLQQAQITSRLTLMKGLFDLQSIAAARRAPAGAAAEPGVDSQLAPPSAPSPTSEAAPSGQLRPSGLPKVPARLSEPPITALLQLGRGQGLKGEAVALKAEALRRHAAVLGTTGSGKTTLALRIIEQLLMTSVPALLIDRKGDLSSYADPARWQIPAEDGRSARREALRRKVDVRLYTPGAPRGRALDLPLAPRGLAQLPTAERNVAAAQAASAIGSMLGFKGAASETPKVGILAKAVELLAEQQGSVTIDALIAVIADRDADLVNLVGSIGENHFRVLAERLQSMKLLNASLFSGAGEELTGELLFGHDRQKAAGKTPLTIICTKGLRTEQNTEFWVARLLSEVCEWANHNPSDHLQAVVFLDEADLYLPATRKPVTKEPLLDLLRRGRSAGLGVLLGTQNPGDFDYKARGNINSWFVGRVSQANDVDKMRALLSEARTDISSKLAQAETGQFYLLRGGTVTAFRAERSVMETKQLSEEQILRLAQASAPAGR